MTDNAVNKSINIPLELEEADTKQVNSFSDAIESLARVSMDTYEDKTSNLTSDNITGQLRCEIINNWKEATYGYRHSSLDLICLRMPVKSMSRGGYGLTALTAIVKGIQASFEQNDGLRALRENALGQRRI
jgi:hypothetical protein